MLPAVLLITPSWTPILLILPLLWGIRRLATGHFLPSTPLDLPLLVMLVMVLVSLFVTFDLAFSLPKVAGLIYGVAVYYAVVAASSLSRQHLWIGVTIFLLMGMCVAVVSLLFVPAAAKLPVLSPVIQRLPSMAGSQAAHVAVNPNEVAGVLLWLAPLSMAVAAGLLAEITHLLRQRWGWSRAGLICLAGLLSAVFITGVLVLTQSRSGLLGLAAGIFFVGLMFLKEHHRLLLSMTALGMAILFLVVGLIQSQEHWRLLLYQVTGVSSGNISTVDLSSRPDIWQRAIYGIEDFAITGMGMGTFREVMPVVYPIFNLGDKDIAHAHNHLFQAALDLGIPGLVAYLALWVGAIAMLSKVFHYDISRQSRTLAVGLTGCLLAYFVYGLTDAVALGARPGFLFWILLGLVASLFQINRRSE
jgi:putative inorganic carbon (HCO3(-)) transporter